MTGKHRHHWTTSLLVLPAVWFSVIVTVAMPVSQQHEMETELFSDRRANAYYHFSLGYLYEQLALEHMNREYLSRAVAEYRAAILADPDSGFLRRQLIQLFARANQLEDAIAEADELLDKNPEDVELLRLMGQIYSRYAFSKRGNTDNALLKKAVAVFERLQQVDSSDTKSLLQLSNLYRALKENDKAAAILRRLLDEEPDSTDALAGLAFLQLDSGDYVSAIEALEKIKTSGVADRNHLTALASAYERMGLYKEATTVYQELLDNFSRGGNPVAIRRGLAHNLVLSGQYKKALKQYEILVEIEHRNPENHLRLSQLYREQRRFDEAHQSLQKAQKLAPSSPEIQYNLVQLLQAEGATGKAIEAMEGLLEATSKEKYSSREIQARTMFLEQLGTLHRSFENITKAEEAFRTMAEISPETRPRALLQIVDNWRTARQYMKALQSLKEAREEFPDDRSLAMLQATVFAETGNADEGAKVLKGLLNEGPLDYQTYLSLAHVYEKGKKFDDAILAVQEAKGLASTDRQKRAVLFTHGSVLERAKRFDEAEEKFRELLTEDPDNASALNYLGYMLADRNVKLRDAHEMIQKALDLDPHNGAYLDSLGWVYYRQNKFELAERYLRRSLQQHKRDPIVLSHLGDVYFKLQQIELAGQHWKRSIEEWERSAPSDRDHVAIAELRRKLSNVMMQSSPGSAREKKAP